MEPHVCTFKHKDPFNHVLGEVDERMEEWLTRGIFCTIYKK